MEKTMKFYYVVIHGALNLSRRNHTNKILEKFVESLSIIGVENLSWHAAIQPYMFHEHENLALGKD